MITQVAAAVLGFSAAITYRRRYLKKAPPHELVVLF